MKINKTTEGSKLFFALEGRLDTTTAPELEAALKETIGNASELVMDFNALDYISSAGLRVILGAQKQFNAKKGKMTIRNVRDNIREVFELTGFIDILTIE